MNSAVNGHNLSAIQRARTCQRCDWAADRESDTDTAAQAIEHGTEAHHPLCIICYRSLRDDESQTCFPCQGRTARTLAYLRQSWPLIQQVRAVPAAQRLGSGGGKSASTTVPGGLGAVLRGGGRSGLIGAPATRKSVGMLHRNDEQSDDGPSLVAELSAWEDDWRSYRNGEGSATVAASVDSALDYLQPRLPWAAQHHPAFDEFASSMTELEGWVHHYLGDSDAPRRDTVPCIDCTSSQGEPIWLMYELDDRGFGWSDNPVCPRCRRVYDGDSRRLAIVAHLRSSQPPETASAA